jgi:hypothetical protein
VYLNKKIDSLNCILRLFCDKDDICTFIDVNPAAVDSDVNPAAVDRNYLRDGLHFNGTGRHIFEQFLVIKLKQVINFRVQGNMPPT